MGRFIWTKLNVLNFFLSSIICDCHNFGISLWCIFIFWTGEGPWSSLPLMGWKNPIASDFILSECMLSLGIGWFWYCVISGENCLLTNPSWTENIIHITTSFLFDVYWVGEKIIQLSSDEVEFLYFRLHPFWFGRIMGGKSIFEVGKYFVSDCLLFDFSIF